MGTGTIITIIVVVVVIVVLLALVASANKKRRLAEDRNKADALRETAHHEHAAPVGDSAREAERRQQEADRAQAEADRAQQGHLQEKARYEDRLREADRVDPDVDHRDSDYSAPTEPDHVATDHTQVPGTAERQDTGTAEDRHLAENDRHDGTDTTDPARRP